MRIDQYMGLGHKAISLVMIIMLGQLPAVFAQNIHASIPKNIDTSQKYVFYLHGAIVQQQGANAISDRFGAYEYTNIVKAFANQGYQVISEVRSKETEIMEYAVKISNEISELLASGVPTGNITVVGASMGGYIAVETAYRLNNAAMNYAVLGLCSNYALEYFTKHDRILCGNFFSIYEMSDQAQTCGKILDQSKCGGNFKELALEMGIGHGFLFKPYAEWINPLKQWMDRH